MHVLLIGGGGREHALAWKLAQSPLLRTLSTDRPLAGLDGPVLPAGADPVAWAREQGVDLVVVGPEAPLAQGIVDRLHEAGVAAFGPTAAGARLEASKAFAKAFMADHNIPTAAAVVCTSAGQARAAARGPCVVKADGLAAGKGVFVVDSADEAAVAIESIFGGRFGSAGAQVLVEERLSGPEVSVLALCDGERAVPLLPCRDHKRRHEGDRGPNTGGMGAVCPPPGVDAGLVEQVRREVLQPVVDGMAAQGTPFRGVLYAGLMLTPAGPKVLEFNVRFGDPECQPLMMMLDEDLLPLLIASATGRLPERALRWHEGAAACVVLCADGYPASARKGDRIEGAEIPEDSAEMVFFAGVRRDGDALLTAGGRVLGVTARGPSLPLALRRAYARVARIRFKGADWRRDIGDSPVC
jgi:phosphoribosylamine--glycine ligase